MASESSAKFQKLIRELFRFDCADLDFGIYRSMNYKRDVIEKFISSSLPEPIGRKLNCHRLAESVVHLLRNLSRVKGIGSLETRGLYPNFILWNKTKHQRSIVLLELHGMLDAEAWQKYDKPRLDESLTEAANASENDRCLLLRRC